MPDNFKVPFFKSKRNSLAVNLTLTAKSAADRANKARTISEFVDNYDVILDCFYKLSKMDGKVTSVNGDLLAEYYQLRSDFQKHLHDAIERSGDEIISGHKKLYKYNTSHTKNEILQFGHDIERYATRFNEENAEFARAEYNFVCHSCDMGNLLEQNSNVSLKNFDDFFVDAVNSVLASGQTSVSFLMRKFKLGYSEAARVLDQMEALGIVEPFNGSAPRKILMTPNMWKACAATLNSANAGDGISCRFCEIDKMDGHEFEYWCAELLRKNGFSGVEVTQGSGDQGVDVLATKDGIKYAIQCKCYSSDLSNKPVQEVNAGRIIYHCHVGAVMTNRFFTSGAKQAADATGVLLWDRNKLAEFLENTKKV